MNRSRAVDILLTLLVSLTLAGCALLEPGGDDEAPLTFNEQLLRMTYEVEVSAFGGISFGDAEPLVENLIVYLLEPEPEQQAAAREALREIFGDAVSAVTLQVRERDSAASEGMRRRLRSVILGRGLTTSLGYNKTADRVKVGVVSAEAVNPVERILTDHGFPLEAVMLRVEEPVRAL